MKSPESPPFKFRQALFLLVFIGLAMWGGWGLARMGGDRAELKQRRERAYVEGEGARIERDAPAAAVTPAAPNPVIPASVTPAPVAPPEPAPASVAPVAAVVETIEEAPAKPAAPVLAVTTVPGAEIRVVADGVGRAIGKADDKGVFRSETLPAGPLTLTAAHKDYEALAPVAITLVAGETASLELRPEATPAALTLLTDAGTVAFLDGVKVGEYTVMLGKVPAGRALTLRLVPKSGEPSERTLTLSPRESRLLDLRTKLAEAAEAPGSTEKLGDMIATIPADSVVPAAAPQEPATPAPVRVPGVRGPARLVAVSPESGLLSLRGATAAAPVAVGAEAVLYAPGTPPVRLTGVRTFGAVSVCKAESVPAGLAAGAVELAPLK